MDNNLEIGRKFLHNFVDAFYKTVLSYFDQHNNHIYTLSEEKCYLLIEDIFESEICKRECRVKRANTEDARLDIWIPQNNVGFAIEIKLSHKSYKSKFIDGGFLKKWKDVINQIEGLDIDKEFNENISKGKKVIGIALHLLVLYSEAEIEKEKFQQNKSYLNDLIEKIEKKWENIDKKLEPHPNFKRIKFFNEHYAIDRYYKEPDNPDKKAIYPALGFIGYIIEK